MKRGRGRSVDAADATNPHPTVFSPNEFKAARSHTLVVYQLRFNSAERNQSGD